MPRTAFSAAFLFVVVTALPGCMGGANLIHQDVSGGVVAIPENTNVWPTYYRDAAYEKIREYYPSFDPRSDIVEQGEYVVGQQTRNDQRVDRRQVGPDGKPVGEVVLNSNTTTTSDLKEFRITFRMKPTLLGNGLNSNGIQQTGGVVRPTDRNPGHGQYPNSPARPGPNNSSMNLDPPPTSLGNPSLGNR